ncbi:phosphate-selective porin OprO and OprP [Methylomarinovum caldicuralii]|uniref:Phosphate-selective porin OprO and OprP n=1 Tax=Methylomarinovum caldicuralii TaxID=438856 RepID=A0AAU9CSL8_9GAMM|nr:porin [Methylomarinovum caldicuralii]BCX80902.1 phosphate-selective porin OprO and OprP [Methylomarinovum caldicuralii]
MRLKKTGVTAMLGLVLAGQGALAADRELLDILLANGAITRDQYDRLLKKKEPLTKNDVEISLKKGLHFKTADGNFETKIGGRMHLQAAYHDRDNIAGQNIDDGLEIRRGRLYAKGVLYHDWKYTAEYDFAGNKTHIKDLWVAYTGLKSYGLDFIGFGHQKQPYSLEVEMSSNDIPFIERALDYGFTEAVVDRALGMRLQTHGHYWFAAAGLYGESIGKGNDEGWGTAGRFILAPLHDQEKVVHLGVRGAYREPNDDRQQDFHYKSTHQSNLKLVNTGTMRNVDNTALVGAEAAFVYGPVSLEGEYTHAMVERKKGLSDLDFDGFHVQATWSLTGESRAAAYKLKDGEFKRLKPHQYFSLSQGGLGAWELAARYAWIDLNDQEVKGGRAQDFTMALNWYLNPNIRLMFDWTHQLNNSRIKQAEDLDIFQLRTQLTF